MRETAASCRTRPLLDVSANLAHTNALDTARASLLPPQRCARSTQVNVFLRRLFSA
jgi:hypothetical protein